jgi:glycosyltransferase involved in cell wall biosynthesis
MNFKPRLKRPFEMFLLGLAKRLHGEGVAVHIVFSEEMVGWFEEEISRWATAYVCKAIRKDWHAGAPLSILRKVKPHVLAFVFIPMNSPRTWLLCRWPGVQKRYYIDQNSWTVSPKRGLKLQLAKVRGRVTSACFDQISSISEHNRRRNIEELFIDPSKNKLIYNGALVPEAQETASRLKEGSPRYLFFAGQLTRDKGVLTLLEAFRALKRTDTRGLQLWMAGAGPEEGALRENSRQWGLEDSVQLLGLRDDVAALMRNAVANVFPSEWAEGFGFVAAEGLASGRPVVVSDAGALPEVVGDVGWIFPRANAEALRETLEDAIKAGLRADYDGQPGIDRFQRLFQLDRMVEEHAAVLLSMTAEARL